MNWDPSTAFNMHDRSQFPAMPAGGSALRYALEHPSATPDRVVSLIPEQMHWHVASEHSWEGMLVRPALHVVGAFPAGLAWIFCSFCPQR